MSRYPQEAAAWSGIQPSLSGWLMLAPCSTRNVTMSTLSSMHAWKTKLRVRRRIKALTSCVSSLFISVHECHRTHACELMLPSVSRTPGEFRQLEHFEMPAHSRAAWNTTSHNVTDRATDVLCLYPASLWVVVGGELSEVLHLKVSSAHCAINYQHYLLIYLFSLISWLRI